MSNTQFTTIFSQQLASPSIILTTIGIGIDGSTTVIDLQTLLTTLAADTIIPNPAISADTTTTTETTPNNSTSVISAGSTSTGDRFWTNTPAFAGVLTALCLVLFGLVATLVIISLRKKHSRRKPVNVKVTPLSYLTNIRDMEVNDNTRHSEGGPTTSIETPRHSNLHDLASVGGPPPPFHPEGAIYPSGGVPDLREGPLSPGLETPPTVVPGSRSYYFLREPPVMQVYSPEVLHGPTASSQSTRFWRRSEGALTSNSYSTGGRSLISYPPNYSQLSSETLPSYWGLSIDQPERAQSLASAIL